MVDWVLANPQPVTDGDMGLLDALENIVYRDGMPHESPGYNYRLDGQPQRIWRRCWATWASTFSGSRASGGF